MFGGPLEAWAREVVEVGLKGRSPPCGVWSEGVHLIPTLNTNRTVLAGTARVELCAQGSSDLAHLDDGPYEAGGEKEQNPRLIPVPANSYLGRDPSTAQGHSNPLFLSLALSPCTHPSVSVIVSLASWFLSLSSSPLSPFTIFWPFSLALYPVFSSLAVPFPGVSPRPAPHRVAFCDQH